MDDLNELPAELRRAVDALDARAARAARRVDVERIAQSVRRRLQGAAEAPAPRLWRVWAMPHALRVAAAVALVVVTGTVAVVRMQRGPYAARTAVGQVWGLDSLSAAQADSLIRVVDEVRTLNAGAPGSSAGTVEDLNAQELRALLQALQNSEEVI